MKRIAVWLILGTVSVAMTLGSHKPVESMVSTTSETPLLVGEPVTVEGTVVLETTALPVFPVVDLTQVSASAAPPPEPEVVAPPVYIPPDGSPSDRQLANLRMCESTNNYRVNTGNGFYGAVQWLRSTWDAVTARMGMFEWVGVRPDLVPAEIQDHVTRWWWANSNPRTQWPVCSLRVGPY